MADGSREHGAVRGWGATVTVLPRHEEEARAWLNTALPLLSSWVVEGLVPRLAALLAAAEERRAKEVVEITAAMLEEYAAAIRRAAKEEG